MPVDWLGDAYSLGRALGTCFNDPTKRRVAGPTTLENITVSDVEANKQPVRGLIDTVWIQGRVNDLRLYQMSDRVNHADPTPEKTDLAALRRCHERCGSFFAGRRYSHPVTDRRSPVVTQSVASMRHTGPFMGTRPTGRPVQLATIRIARIPVGEIAEHWSMVDMAGLVQQTQA